MRQRQASWCSINQHDWHFTTTLAMGLPRTDGAVPTLLIRACTRCPLAESMHILARSRPAMSVLRDYEHWSVEEKLPGWNENLAIWNKDTERRSSL